MFDNLKTIFDLHNLPPVIRSVLVILLVALASLGAVTVFHANENDTRVISEGALKIIADEAPYELDGRAYTTFMTPPHVSFLGLPFLIFGPDWSAFWDTFFVLLVLTFNERWLQALLAKLLFMGSAAVIILIAAANITGTVTGIGLLLLLLHVSGFGRGVAWAFLLLRPQDGWAFLLYDGLRSLWERDFLAPLVTLSILLVPLVFSLDIYREWLGAMYFPLFVDTPVGYSLSLRATAGLPIAFLFYAVVVGIRSVVITPGFKLRWRSPTQMSEAERFWLLGVAALMLGTYTAYYQLWLVLIIVRDYKAGRTLLLLAIWTVVGFSTMVVISPERFQVGLIILILITALISPRSQPPQTDEVTQPDEGAYPQISPKTATTGR